MRNFTATVKERSVGEPCFVVIELSAEPASRHVVLDLAEGTDYEDARAIANLLNASVTTARIGL